MRVAIPVSEGWIAPVFDSATRLLVVDVGPGRSSEVSELPSFVRPADQRSEELASLGIDVLLCDGISENVARCIRERGIEIRSSIFRAVDEILSSLSELSRTISSRHAPAH